MLWLLREKMDALLDTFLWDYETITMELQLFVANE